MAPEFFDSKDGKTSAPLLNTLQKSMQPKNPLDIFISPRYSQLQFAPANSSNPFNQDPMSTFWAVNVPKFLSEGCLMKSVVMGLGGAGLGVLFGTFFFTLKPVDVDSGVRFKDHMRLHFKSFIPDVKSTARNFAKIGALYSLIECFIERERAVHDVTNAVYAGCITGAILARSAGPMSMLGGCTMFGTFSGLIEKYQSLS